MQMPARESIGLSIGLALFTAGPWIACALELGGPCDDALYLCRAAERSRSALQIMVVGGVLFWGAQERILWSQRGRAARILASVAYASALVYLCHVVVDDGPAFYALHAFPLALHAVSQFLSYLISFYGKGRMRALAFFGVLGTCVIVTYPVAYYEMGRRGGPSLMAVQILSLGLEFFSSLSLLG